MELRDDNLVIKAGPGTRQQALDYGIARFREREKTKRILIIAVTALAIASGIQIVFAPEGREIVAWIITPVLLVLSLGAIGASRFVLKTPAAEISADESADKPDPNAA